MKVKNWYSLKDAFTKVKNHWHGGICNLDGEDGTTTELYKAACC